MAVSAVVYVNALMVKVRDQGHVINKAVYLALGVNLHGLKELLGIWIEETEGAKFWLKIITELKNRGVKDIFIACVDGLKGLPEAIEAVFPKTEIQLCMVHMVRNSMRFVSYKDRKAVVADLKAVYQAVSAESALAALDAFAQKWDSAIPRLASRGEPTGTGCRRFLPSLRTSAGRSIRPMPSSRLMPRCGASSSIAGRFPTMMSF
jgi:putative transposase